MQKLLALITIALCLTLSGGGVAQEQADPPLPRERPAPTAPVPVDAPVADPAAATPATSSEPALPRERPEPTAPVAPAAAEPAPIATADPPVEEPTPPPRDYQVACPAVMNGDVTAKALPPIHENMCGLQSPLSLEAVTANGRSVPLNASVITDCGMATAMPAWISELDSYVFAHDKTRIKEINVSTNYACRNVDNAKTGNLSFHAFADALDIIGFSFEDGRTIDLKTGWAGTPEQGSQIWRFARDSACTHFMTVLGPEADSFHQDNLHIDLACHGKSCMTRLCQ